MTPVSHGKPCAGNPHARFDEGASASEKPRRNALLHSTKLTIPEWVGSTLTNGAFLDYAERSLAAYVAEGLDAISLTEIGMKLTESVDALKLAVNRQSAYDETSAVVRADNDRDALFKALYHAWNFLDGLSPTHTFAAHVETLRSEMSAYKSVWKHEMRKETTELQGLQAALALHSDWAYELKIGKNGGCATCTKVSESAKGNVVAFLKDGGERDARSSETL